MHVNICIYIYILNLISSIHMIGHLLLHYIEYFDTEYNVLHLINTVHEIFNANVCMLMFSVH